MKIKVAAPLKNNEIKALLDGYECENGTKIQFLEKMGTNLTFDVTGENDSEKAISQIKSIIKSTEFGKVLYFSVLLG